MGAILLEEFKGKSDERTGMKAPKLWVEMCGKGTKEWWLCCQLGVLGGGGRSRGARGNPSSRQLPILSRIQAQEGSPTLPLKCMCPVHMPVYAFPGRRSESKRPETHISRGPSRYSYYPRNSNNWQPSCDEATPTMTDLLANIDELSTGLRVIFGFHCLDSYMDSNNSQIVILIHD